jgi:hypothetical protein
LNRARTALAAADLLHGFGQTLEILSAHREIAAEIGVREMPRQARNRHAVISDFKA